MTRATLTTYILSSLMIGWLNTSPTLGADSTSNNGQSTLVLDVALDATTLGYSRSDAWTSGPNRGDTYVVSGFVYAGFSIPDGDTSQSFAPDSDGSIGSIAITGVYTSDAAPDGSSPMLATTTHVISMYNADGMVSQGIEGVFPQIRALLGGTGQYSGAIGQVTEEVLGANGTGGYNLRFTFQLVQLNPQDNSTSQTAQARKAMSQKARRHRR